MSNEVVETAFRFSAIEKSLSCEFRADFPNYLQGLVRGDPGGFVLTQKYADRVDVYRNVPLRADDVWIVTFPKCGKIDRINNINFFKFNQLIFNEIKTTN